MTAPQMLPLDRRWYRELLVVAALVGGVVGVLGLAYLGITGAMTDLVFGDPRIQAWSGEWWWVGVTAGGGLAVTALRQWWKVPQKVPGGVAIIESGVVNPRVVLPWVGLALVSAVAGASLGPSFALVMMGGGLASWIASRRWPGNEDARLQATSAGIAGGFGGAFTSPLLGTIMVSELAPVPRRKYIEAVVPQLIAATVGFGLYFGVVGTTFLNSFAIPVDDFRPSQLLVGAVLGAASSLLMVTFVVIVKLVSMGAAKLTHPYVRGGVLGGLVGLIAVALPLTVGAGNSQLTSVIDNAATISVWLLVAVLVGKMLAMALSLAAGFIGGNVLPMLFVGGTAGVIAHQLFPSIPYAIAVGCMLSAVPGATIRAPLGLTAIASLSIGLGPVTTAPVAVAVVTAHVLTSAIVRLMQTRTSVPAVHA
ncbi:MAG: chloride channel protein [Jiangellales bacterium]